MASRTDLEDNLLPLRTRDEFTVWKSKIYARCNAENTAGRTVRLTELVR